MKTPLGYMFLCLALYFVFRAHQKKQKIKECHGNRISATVINNAIQTLSGGFFIYYPVYSYEKDSEIHTYQSEFPSLTALQIGLQVPLYYNELTRCPVEVLTATTETTLAVVFGTIAMLML